MTSVVRSVPQYSARNPLVNHTTTKVFDSGGVSSLPLHAACRPTFKTVFLYQPVHFSFRSSLLMNVQKLKVAAGT
jgi:hypothetical protein